MDPAELFPILTEATVVAHNALFDLGFLTALGFEAGKVADTMILSQLLLAGAKFEPLKRGQTSHRFDSVVKRELRLELDKTHQSADWGGATIDHTLDEQTGQNTDQRGGYQTKVQRQSCCNYGGHTTREGRYRSRTIFDGRDNEYDNGKG